MVRRSPTIAKRGALVLAAFLGLFATQALGADAGSEGVPGGPPACSVLARSAPPSSLYVDLWVQCNYEVSELAVKSSNRRFTSFPRSGQLLGAAPEDSMACARRGPKAATCKGRVPTLARFHAVLMIDEGICKKPRLRLTVYTAGGPECTGNCPGLLFQNWTPSPTNNREMGCFGS
jgi:hypothetical protein